VSCHCIDGDAAAVWRELPWRELVFARQLTLVRASLMDLPASNRADPIAASVAAVLRQFSQLWLEHPDTNEGKQLSRFCRRFTGPVQRALADQGVVTDAAGAPRLHLFFTDSAHVQIAVSEPTNSAPWPMGIPRLRRPRDAPSRSTLKLDEAIQTFMDASEREAWLQPGMSAVDLGAAPGGWSWQLIQRHMRVTAVDNGPLDADLLTSPLVEHVVADGFRYRPPQPVDWLVCDIVEQPQRVLDLVIAWLERGDCDGAIANLKLPMKRRQATVSDALQRLQASAILRGRRMGVKQLYHDREEVTLFVAPRS
jgi:23S rRNA (cytidine2498-2'-O)-methyltransferase